MLRRRQGTKFWVYHEKHVRKSGSPEDAIDPMISVRPGRVDIAASRTVELDRVLARDVRQPDRQHQLVIAVNSRTVAEIAVHVLLDHLHQSEVRQNEARVNQAVKRLRRYQNVIRYINTGLHA